MPKIKTALLLALVVLLAGSSIFLPSFSLGVTELYNEKRIVQGIILFFGGITFLLHLAESSLNISRKTIFLFSLLSALLLVSIALSAFPQWALLEFGWYLCLVQLALVVGFLYQKYPVRFERIILFTLVCLATIYSVRVLGDVTTSFFREDWPIWPHRSRFSIIIDGKNLVPDGFLGFQNIRFFNHVQTWTLPVLGYLYILYENRSENYLKYFAGALLSIWFMLAFASGARGTLLAVALSLIVILFLFGKNNVKKLTGIIIFTLFAGLLLYLFIFHLLIPEGSGKAIARTGSSRRLELWGVALQAIWQNPVTGLGPIHLANVNGLNPITSPHNIYLTWAAEWGIPAFLVFMYLVYNCFKVWIKQVISQPSNKKIALTAALIAGAIHSGISGLMITPLSQLIFVVLLGWIIGISYTQSGAYIFQKGRTNVRYAIVLVIILVNLFTFYKFTNDIPHLKENRDRFQILHRSNQLSLFPTTYATTYPRFWDQGFIGIEYNRNKNASLNTNNNP